MNEAFCRPWIVTVRQKIVIVFVEWIKKKILNRWRSHVMAAIYSNACWIKLRGHEKHPSTVVGYFSWSRWSRWPDIIDSLRSHYPRTWNTYRWKTRLEADSDLRHKFISLSALKYLDEDCWRLSCITVVRRESCSYSTGKLTRNTYGTEGPFYWVVPSSTVVVFTFTCAWWSMLSDP